MNLLLRLIRVIIHACFRSDLNIKDTSVVRFRVWFHDLDVNRHMTNSRYLAVMDLGRTDLTIRSGLAKIVWKNRWSPVLGSASIRWRKSLELFQKYEVHTRLAGWDEKWFYLDQKVMRQGRVVAHALQKAIFVGRDGSVPARTIVDLFEVKHGSLAGYTLPDSIAKWQASEAHMRDDIVAVETSLAQHHRNNKNKE